jgi:DNA-binding winged helix-turn-helix (wHTH) protein/tetratricopeptide (TPR) repeat protein
MGRHSTAGHAAASLSWALQRGQLAMRHAFGPFVLDEAGTVLCRGAETVPLGRRSLALLRALLQRNGEPVSKEQLRAEIWSGRVVEDVNLSVQVAHLRKALGRTAEGHEWVVTVPRFGYRLAASDPTDAAVGPLPMLAVLPFQNLGGDPQRQYIVDGFVDELISALSRFRGFGVFSRSARPPFVAAAGAAVYRLEGSVQVVAGVIRVVAMLADHAGRSLWSERFSGRADDLLAFEDHVVRGVASTITPRIQATELARSNRKPPASLDAYDLYLRGMARLYAFTAAANAEAIALLERAIAIEPDNGVYLGFCAWALEMRITLGWPVAPDIDDRRCVELANRAVELAGDDAVVLAHCGLALQLVGREYQRGLSVVERAVALNPNDPVALLHAGIAHYIGGRLDTALERLHACVALQPNHAYEAMGVIGNVMCTLGRFDEALASARRALAINANYEPGHWVAVAAPAQLGRLDEAKAALASMLARHPGLTLTKLTRVHPMEAAREDRLLEGLRLAGLPD